MRWTLARIAAVVLLFCVHAVRGGATTADDLCAPTADPCVVASLVAVTDGSIIDVGNRELRVAAGGTLEAGIGSMSVFARILTVAANGAVRAIGGLSFPGGSLLLSASAELDIQGTVTASGFDGGTIVLTAGEMVVGPGGVVRSDATAIGGFGGEIEVHVQGGGDATGNLVVDGQLAADGRSGAEAGGNGGFIEVVTSGDIRGATTGRLSAVGGAPDGEGGDIELAAAGIFDLGAEIDVRSAGAFGGAGSIICEAQGDLIVRSEVVATGGAPGGGDVVLQSLGGSVSLQAGVDACGAAGGPGGAVAVTGGPASDGIASVTIGAAVQANGTGAAPGGIVRITGRDGVLVGAQLSASGGLQGGKAGTVSVQSPQGQARIDAPLLAIGTGVGASGGSVVIDAAVEIAVNAELNVQGDGGGSLRCSDSHAPCVDADDCILLGKCEPPGGGEIRLTSLGAIEVGANLVARSSAGRGGRIQMESGADLTIAAEVVADGSSALGGQLTARACAMTVCGLDSPLCGPGAAGTLSSLGANGTNRLEGRGRQDADDPSVMVLGEMRASAAGGRNELVFNGSTATQPVVLGTVNPREVVIDDPSLIPCAPLPCAVPGSTSTAKACTPTPTATATATEDATVASPTHTATDPPTASPTPTTSPTPSLPDSPTVSSTPTPPPPTPSPTATGTSPPSAPTNFAYVVSFGNPDSVRVIDTLSNAVSPLRIELPLGGELVTVSPDGALAYVSAPNGLTIIDTAANRITKQLSVFAPSGIERPVGRVAFSADGAFAYVVNGDNPALAVIDTSAHEVVDTIPLNGAIGDGDPGAIGVTADGKVYVTPLLLEGGTSIAAVDLVERTVHEIAPPCSLAISQDLAVTPDGTRVYVPLFGCQQIEGRGAGATAPPCVGDCDGNAEVSLEEVIKNVNIALGSASHDACPDRSGGSNDVTIATLVGAVAAALDTCEPPALEGNGIVVINVESNRILRVISFGSVGPGGSSLADGRGAGTAANGTGIDITPDGRFVYVAGCDIPNLVCVVDTRDDTLDARIPAFSSGQFAFDVAITPDARLAYVTQTTGAQVAVIDIRTNARIGALFIPDNRGIAAGRRPG